MFVLIALAAFTLAFVVLLLRQGRLTRPQVNLLLLTMVVSGGIAVAAQLAR